MQYTVSAPPSSRTVVRALLWNLHQPNARSSHTSKVCTIVQLALLTRTYLPLGITCLSLPYDQHASVMNLFILGSCEGRRVRGRVLFSLSSHRRLSDYPKVIQEVCGSIAIKTASPESQLCFWHHNHPSHVLETTQQGSQERKGKDSKWARCYSMSQRCHSLKILFLGLPHLTGKACSHHSVQQVSKSIIVDAQHQELCKVWERAPSSSSDGKKDTEQVSEAFKGREGWCTDLFIRNLLLETTLSRSEACRAEEQKPHLCWGGGRWTGCHTHGRDPISSLHYAPWDLPDSSMLGRAP